MAGVTTEAGGGNPGGDAQSSPFDDGVWFAFNIEEGATVITPVEAASVIDFDM